MRHDELAFRSVRVIGPTETGSCQPRGTNLRCEGPIPLKITVDLRISLAEAEPVLRMLGMQTAAQAASTEAGPKSHNAMRIGPAQGPRSIADALAEWEAARRNTQCDPRYIAEVLTTLRAFAAHAGIHRCDDITRESVRAWMSSFGDEIGPVTRRHRRNRLAMFSRWLVANDYLPTDPLASLERIRVKRRQARIVPTESDMARFIAATATRPKAGDRWLCYLLLATSNIRAHSTLAKMQRWMYHHEPENGLAWIDIPGDCLKNGQDARVYLPRETALYLDAHVQTRPDRWFAQLPKWDRFEMDREHAGFPKTSTPAGVKGPTFSPHSLRHFASNRLRWVETFSDEERAKQNTHREVSMTKRVYSDSLHPDYGRRVYRMQPLLGPEFAPPTKGKAKKPLDKQGTGADDGAASPTHKSQPSREQSAGLASAHAETRDASTDGRRAPIDPDRQSQSSGDQFRLLTPALTTLALARVVVIWSETGG